MVVTAVVSPTCREVFVVNDFYDVSICHMVNNRIKLCPKLISSQVNFVPKDRTSSCPKGTFTPPPPPSWLSQNCRHAVVFLFPLKHNRHDTFSACRNCRRDRTRVYLDDNAVTVVNSCQRVATTLFFMFPFGREHYSVSDDTYNTFATVTTKWKPGFMKTLKCFERFTS